MTKFSSTAFPFNNLFTTGVSPRTNMFNLGIKVGRFLGAGGQTLDLMLGYNWASTDNVGFGKGWTLNLSHFDPQSRRLTLASGQSYRLKSLPPDSRDDNVIDLTDRCQYLKIKNIKVEYATKTKSITVTHKDNSKEIFNENGTLKQLIAASGHSLKFEYKSNNRLISITDSASKEFKIAYEQAQTVFTSSDSRRRAIKTNGSKQLDAVEVEGDYGIRVTYTANHPSGMDLIESVKRDSGATETLSYEQNGWMAMPDKRGSWMPSVSAYEISGNGITTMRKQYHHDKTYNNATLRKVSGDLDAFMECKHNYEYRTIEEVKGVDGISKYTIRVYNKYHLLVQEYVADNPLRKLARPNYTLYHKRTIEYYVGPTKNFKDQVPQYLSPKKETVYFYGPNGALRTDMEPDTEGDATQFRKEISTSEYDRYGNILNQTDAYGIKTEFIYAENSRTVQNTISPYLLSRKIIYSSTESPVILPLNTYYYYKKIKRFDDTNNTLTYTVLDTVSELVNVPRVIYLYRHTIDSYDTTGNAVTHGFPLKKTTQYYPSDVITVEDYLYTVDLAQSTMLTTTNITKNKKSTRTINKLGEVRTKSSLHTGLELESVDMLGITTRKKYTTNDLVKEEVNRVGTPFEFHTTYTYNRMDDTDDKIIWEPITVMIKNGDGTHNLVNYDSLGRETSTEYGMPADWKKMQKMEYNVLGQVSTVTVYDQFEGDEIAVKTIFEYDLFGEVCKETAPSGVIRIVERDRKKNTVKTYVKALDGTISDEVTEEYNTLGLVVKSTSPTSTISHDYDGLGRLIKTINPWGKETSYELDNFNRVSLETFKANPELVIKKTFDTRTAEELVTEIKVNDTIMGNREYDDIGRMTSETKGAYTSGYVYGTLSSQPTQVTRPDKSVIKYVINTTLDEVEKCTTGNNIEIASYTFENTTGRMLTAKNNDFELGTTYYENGTVKSETQSGKTASYIYSRQGRLLSSKDYFGKMETHTYDPYHRLKKTVSTTGSSVELEYDKFDRVCKETVTSTDSILPIMHHYIFDKQSRLIEKKTQSGSMIYLTQGYEFYKDGRLKKKTLKDQASNTTTEEYIYDDYGRLKTFTASGSQSPNYLDEDQGATPISKQEYLYDFLGNVKEVKVQFEKNNTPQSDTITYTYEKDLCQTINRTYPTSSIVTLQYDDNGNVKKDEQSRDHAYNVLGQLTKVTKANQYVTEYKYGANGIQLEQTIPNQEKIQLFYGAGGLVNEAQGTAANSHLLSVNGHTLHRAVKQESKTTGLNLIGDYKNSTILEILKTHKNTLSYDSYGKKAYEKSSSTIPRIPTLVVGWTSETAMFFWDDGKQSEFNFKKNEFVVSKDGFDENGLRVGSSTFNNKKLIANVVTYYQRNGDPFTAFWNDDTNCKWSGGQPDGKYSESNKITGWPQGVQLIAALNFSDRNNGVNQVLFFWSNETITIFYRGIWGNQMSPNQTFWGETYSLKDVFPKWPTNKKLLGAVSDPRDFTPSYLFWNDGTYSRTTWSEPSFVSDLSVLDFPGWPLKDRPRDLVAIVPWNSNTAMFYWNDNKQSQFDFGTNSFFMGQRGFDDKGLGVNALDLGGKKIIAIVNHPNGTRYVFWDNDTHSQWNLGSDNPDGRFFPNTNWVGWPAGKKLIAAGTNNSYGATYFFWSDNTYSTFDNNRRAFTGTSLSQNDFAQNWPTNKKLIQVINHPINTENTCLFWDDATFTTYTWGSKNITSFGHVSEWKGWPSY